MIKKFNENWGALEDGKRDNDKDRWKQYWNKMSRDINFEMDTIAEYAMKNSISYEDAQRHFKEESPKKEVKFGKGFEVVGLPSGQLIYMNLQQLNYFKARDIVKWTKIWKKPTAGGFNPINMDSYTFEDKFYKNIIDVMDTITWN